MPGFAFKARDRSGSLVEGEVECPDRSSAILRIERLHGTPIMVRPATAKTPPPKQAASNGKAKANAKPSPRPRRDIRESAPEGSGGKRLKLSTKQQLFLTKQLAKLLKSGMTLEKALSALSERSGSVQLREVTAILHKDLTEGARFSEALEKFPETFSRIYVSLVAAGETSGSLPLILRRLATYQEQNRKLLQSVKMAMVYPALLCVVGGLVIVVFVTWVVPQLTEFLQSTGAEMPLPTRILIGVHEFGQSWWWAFLLAGVMGWLGFRRWVGTDEGQLSWDRIKLRLPIIGRLIWTRFSAQAAMTLGTLLSQGVLLSRALNLIKEIGGNLELSNRMETTVSQVEDGGSLSQAAGETRLFPDMFLDMLQVGERSGELAESLEGIAEHYEEEVEVQTKLISTLVPMVVILLISAVVGAVVICIFMAVLNVSTGLRRSLAGLEIFWDLPWT